MIWFDHSRRAASVLLVVLCLLGLPAVAEATFTSSRGAGVTVGTARLDAPAMVTGTYRCKSGFLSSEGFDVTVGGFSDNGIATAYTYSLLRGNSVVKSTTSSSKSVTLTSGNLAIDGGSTQWSLTIQSRLGTWTGTSRSWDASSRASTE